jgi:hypothetical protein
MSATALLGVLVMGLNIAAARSTVLCGEVKPIGGSAVGAVLERAVTKAFKDDGSSVEDMGCPMYSHIVQGLVTLCEGTVDGSDVTATVVFEDDTGSFIIHPL